MKQFFVVAILVFGFVGLGMAGNSRADLTILLNGDNFGRPADVTGSGNLTNVMRAAADTWEQIFRLDTSIDGFTLDIDYQWGDLAGSTLGLHSLQGQADFGSIHRETDALITFDNTDNPVWFLDSTPFDNSEYSIYTETMADLGGGELVTGRTLTGASGDAFGAIDLYSVALHEIGHALGLSSANSEFIREARTEGDDTIEVESPLPHAGSIIDVEGGSAHLLGATFSDTLMRPSIGSSMRRFASDADILANAQISQFNAVSFTAVPEPSSLAILFSLTSLVALRRRKA